MTDENIKEYAKMGARSNLRAKCAAIEVVVNRSTVEAVKAAAEAYLELCDEEGDDT